MEPATKKAKTEDGAVITAGGDEAKEKEPETPSEQEQDAPADKSARIKEPITFHTEETTMNVMPSSFGNIIMPLTDGGFQYLLAGCRANVGVKSGRYMFEVKILEQMSPMEDAASKQRIPGPKALLRVGVSVAGSSLFLGEAEECACFDTEGAFTAGKKRTMGVAEKFNGGDVLAIVLNLDEKSPSANTLSLFRNGKRAGPPQAIPESLHGQALFPTFTFKNLTLHYNFGPVTMSDLPFTCRTLQDATQSHATVTPQVEQPKDGKYEVIFPVCLPDEGMFDWLDLWLERNPSYIELSDRAILSWAQMSGIQRPKGYTARASNDKPEMGFGIALLDDLSARKVLQAVAPLQKRNYIVVEVKSNLMKDERKQLASCWSPASFRRVASVMIGEPPQVVKKRAMEMTLKQKQEVSDLDFRAKQAVEKQKKLIEKRQRQLEREKKKAEKRQKKLQEEMKRKFEVAKKKQEGVEVVEEEKKEEEEKDDEEEAEKSDEEMPDEEPPKVQLTPEEKKLWFRKAIIPDLTGYVMNTAFARFSLPEKEDGFEEIKLEWSKADKCKEHVQQWISARKLTSRVEDIMPSDWFAGKWKDWQKVQQSWHGKQNNYKVAQAKKVTDLAAKEAKRKAREAAKEKGETVEEEEEKAEEEDAGSKVDTETLDVFGVEDVLDIGGGEPIFANFGFEDWTMASLRYELHTLTHAFKRDVNDPERVGMFIDHLPFYYNKYYKKALNPKFFGVETLPELLDFVHDTVVLNPKNKVLESQLPDDLESVGIFTMLTEEARRDRNRRVDMGDESARLKMVAPQQAVIATPALQAAGVRPPMPGIGLPVMMPTMARPGFAQVPQQVRPPQQVQVPAWFASNQARPPVGPGQSFQQAGFRPGFPMQQQQQQVSWRPGPYNR